MKLTEPLILTARFSVFDREPYRAKMEKVICLLLRIANRTTPKKAQLPILFDNREPHQKGTVNVNRTAAKGAASNITLSVYI